MESSGAVRVLLVDDDPDGANSTAMLLRHFGADAHAVCDARLACDEARAFEPDLMLIDLSMPHLDGCALAKQLRDTRQFDATPLVVVSGHTDPEQRALCAAAGFDQYLVKPVPLAILVRLLDEARRAKAIAAEAPCAGAPRR
jgi:CheY-like chemotaxis protein